MNGPCVCSFSTEKFGDQIRAQQKKQAHSEPACTLNYGFIERSLSGDSRMPREHEPRQPVVQKDAQEGEESQHVQFWAVKSIRSRQSNQPNGYMGLV
jgi:hypothetical protein